MNKHRNYLSGVSVGMIAFGTLAVGLSTALPAVGAHADNGGGASVSTQVVKLTVENTIQLRITTLNGKPVGKDGKGIAAWSSNNDMGETKNQHNKLTFRTEIDTDYEMKIDGKTYKTGKSTAGKDVEIQFDLPAESNVGEHRIEIIAKGKDKKGEAVSASTLGRLNWTAVLPSVVPGEDDHRGDHGNTDHGNTDHGNTDHGNTDHGNKDHGNTDHGNTDHGNKDHGNTDHGNTDYGNTEHKGGDSDSDSDSGSDNGGASSRRRGGNHRGGSASGDTDDNDNDGGNNGFGGSRRGDNNHRNRGNNDRGNRNDDNQRNHRGRGYGKNGRGYRAPNSGYFIINGQAYSKSTTALIIALIAAGAVAVTSRKLYIRELLGKNQK